MAHFSVKRLTELDRGLILSPERYDPRKTEAYSEIGSGYRLFDLVSFERSTVSKENTATSSGYKIFDTGHARSGFLAGDEGVVLRDSLGSAKKKILCGDVIISRLRSYLKQIAWIDAGVDSRPALTCVSTEFFVLRSTDEQSIAFLVPFLLSDPVQRILAASQEGGHHPRFNESDLRDLVVPDSLIEMRHEISRTVEESINAKRSAEQRLRTAVNGIHQLFEFSKHPSQSSSCNAPTAGATT